MRSGLPPSLFRGPAGAGRRGGGGARRGGGGCRALLGRFNAFLGFNRTWLTLPVVISLGPLFRFAPKIAREGGGGRAAGVGAQGGAARRPASAGVGGVGVALC